jgi:23S rRNA pseudouridine1911/1915/1917 synthase
VPERVLPVPDGLVGERVDAGVAKLLGLSRTRVAAIADAGGIEVDFRSAGRSDRLPAGGLLSVRWEEERERASGPPEAIEVPGMTVVHEDDDLIVVDKPAGVAAHPSPGWTGTTVVGGLAAAGVRISTSGAEERAGVVHRLDAGTSGLMVVAKSEPAYTALKRAFKERTVDKQYLALAQGHPDPTRGTIDAPIGRHPRVQYRFAVVTDGKPSVTHYETLEAFRAATLLDVHLETGRTHQIRVHFAHLRHPLVGDTMYGADPQLAERLGVERQWLHAAHLAFDHPGTGERVAFDSPLPADLETALDRLRD